MYKLMTLVATVLTAAVLCGCASVSVVEGPDLNGQKLARSGKSVAHLQAENWGIYLFMIPLITGSTDNPGSMVFLQDTVTVKNAIQMLTAKSNELKASGTYNIVTKNSTNPWFFGVKRSAFPPTPSSNAADANNCRHTGKLAFWCVFRMKRRERRKEKRSWHHA